MFNPAWRPWARGACICAVPFLPSVDCDQVHGWMMNTMKPAMKVRVATQEQMTLTLELGILIVRVNV